MPLSRVTSSVDPAAAGYTACLNELKTCFIPSQGNSLEGHLGNSLPLVLQIWASDVKLLLPLRDGMRFNSVLPVPVI